MNSSPGTLPLDIPSSFEDADIEWLDDMTIQCKGVKLHLTPGFELEPSTNDVITLFKDPVFLRSYVDHLDGFRVDNMIELGIWDGGSAVFFWNLLKPSKLCCIDLKQEAVMLDDYINREHLSESFRVHYGVDQADKSRLRRILEEEYGDAELDLVVDDASHLYTPTRATFEILFPRIREGGLFFMEDWKANLAFPYHGGGESPDFPPFHQLAHDLLEVSMRAPKVISSVKCYHNFVVLERGPEPISETDFDIGAYLAASRGD